MDTSPPLPSNTIQLDGFRMQPIQRSNLSVLADIWSDPEVTRFLPSQGKPVSRQNTEKAIASFVDHWQSNQYGVWEILDNASGLMIGYCGLRYLEEIDDTEVLYGLAKDYWGRGIATQAVRAAIAYGFEQAALSRIVALSFPENKASRRVMEKAGLRYEGRISVFGLDAVCYAVEQH